MKDLLNVLPSGIKVITMPFPGEMMKVIATFRAGSRDETLKQSGLAHFVEHMVFTGTKRRSKNMVVLDFDALGAVWNAETNLETTTFFVTFLKEDLLQVLDLLSDILCKPSFPKEAIDAERKIVLHELENEADDCSVAVCDAMHALLFKGSGISKPIMGRKRTVSGFSRKEMVSFYKKFYSRANLTLMFVGDITPEKTAALSEDYFGCLPYMSVPTRRRTSYGNGEDCILRENSNIMLNLSFNTFCKFGDDAVLCVMSSILENRVMSNVCFKKALAYSTGVDYVLYSDASFLSFHTECIPENVKKILDVFVSEINKIKLNPVLDRELAAAQKSYKVTRWRSLSGLESLASEYSAMVANGTCVDYEKQEKQIESIGKEDIMEFAKEVFVHPSLVVLGPSKPEVDLNYIKSKMKKVK